MFNNVYRNTKVFVTGHTGFKGSWLTLYLLELGAEVFGYALEPPSLPNHYDLLQLEIESCINDIRDVKNVHKAIESFRPDIIFHLAAQPLVRRSYKKPIETISINIMGTTNLLEACRNIQSVKSIVIITSDKCYQNQEWIWGYRESDPVGGSDPYSASKACVELITASYRNSFFPLNQYLKNHQTLVASARAGNVIGGGDWGKDRLVPEIMCAARDNKKVAIRNPQAIRPWQHVLEPLSGYLLLGQKLLEKNKEYAEAWNFGPSEEDHTTVSSVVRQLKSWWDNIDFEIIKHLDTPRETNILKLDSSKARSKLGWKPVWNTTKALKKTSEWYREYYEFNRLISHKQLLQFLENKIQKKYDQ